MDAAVQTAVSGIWKGRPIFASVPPRYGQRAPSRAGWRERAHSQRARSRSESAFTGEMLGWLEYVCSKEATIVCRHIAKRLGATETTKGWVRFDEAL